LINTEKNGLLYSLYIAYTHHYAIRLRPDDIWLAILNGFQNHVNKNAKELRSKFVNHDGKKEILIRRDDFVLDKENPWDQVFGEFAKQCQDNIKNPDLYNVVSNSYSTSTAIDVAAYNISFMSTLKKYFDFTLMTLCGIPEIKLLGTKEDWIELKIRTLKLKDYMVEKFADKWFGLLIPILDEFIKVFMGEIDKTFWSLIFKEYKNEGSGAYINLSGWFNIFFPYLKHEPNTYIFNFKSIDDFKNTYNIKNGVDINDIPNLEYSVPVNWLYYNKKYNLEFRTGSLGVCADFDKNEIYPHSAYYVYRN